MRDGSLAGSRIEHGPTVPEYDVLPTRPPCRVRIVYAIYVFKENKEHLYLNKGYLLKACVLGQNMAIYGITLNEPKSELNFAMAINAIHTHTQNKKKYFNKPLVANL